VTSIEQHLYTASGAPLLHYTIDRSPLLLKTSRTIGFDGVVSAAMSKDEFTNAITALDLTRADTAEVLHVSLRSVYSYLSGEFPVPDLIAATVRLMVEGVISTDDLRDAA
jgi:hypothetical protein